MRTDLDFAFLTGDASRRVDHDLELGLVFRLESLVILLELFRNDVAIHVLFPDVIRETFLFLQVNDIVQATTVVAIFKTLHHHGIHLNQGKVQTALVLEHLRNVTLGRNRAEQHVVHFPAVFFKAFQVRFVFRIEKLLSPDLGHGNPRQKRVIAFVEPFDTFYFTVHRGHIHGFYAPSKFRRHKILEIATGLIHHVVTMDLERIAHIGIGQVRVCSRHRSHFFFALQVNCRKIPFCIELHDNRSIHLILDIYFRLTATAKEKGRCDRTKHFFHELPILGQ